MHIKIQSIKHSAGQPIEKHLMLMEHQFSRLNDLRKPLDEAHYAALILASIKESGEFSHIFHSAMWGDEDSLTITKLKSALISSQHHTKQSPDEQAHKSFASRPSNKYPHQKSQHSVKAHNRKPRNPDKGWNCSFCQMDNHSYENCFKRKPSNSQQSFNNKTLTKKFSNFSDTPNIPQAEESASYAIAHASRHNSQYSHVSPRHSPYTAQCPSIRHRLGPMPSCPDETSYQSARSYSCDILNAEFVPSFESDDEQDCVYVPSRECHDDSNLLNTYTGKLIKYHRSTLNLNNKFSFLQTRLNQDSRASINRTKQQSSSEIDLSYSEISMNKQVNFNPVNCYFKNLILYSAMPSMNYLANHSKIKNKIIKNTLNSETESVWIIDSGATLNICNSKAYLKEFKPSSGHNVIISDGTPVPIEGYGKLNIKIFMNKSEERFKSLTLNNIAYVPSFDVNLISVRALTLSGLSLKFDQIGCSIDDGNITIPFGYVSNSCYLLNIKHSQTKGPMAMTCIHEIHRKLGHRNIKHILKVKDNLKLKFAKCNCSQECFGCLKGKFHSIPFPQKAVKPTNPRDIITTDVCGPFNTQSLGGARYFVTFTCAHSDYTEVAAIKHKSDCKAELMNYITRLITQFGHPPKIIRSDRGGEYIDSELQSFLCSKGIIFQCTVPRCPQQNGISERKNRTLLEAIRTTLMYRNLPKYLWAEALHYANDTFNAIPHDTNLQSPRDIFYDISSNHEFIEFGTRVCFISNPQGRSKLDERGIFGRFVGYDHNSKGFRIFINGKIRIERHVKFLNDSDVKINETVLHINEEKCDNQNTELIQNTDLITEPRRSERIRAKQAHSTSEVFEPKTYKQALNCPEKDKWILAMEEELRSIRDNDTWSTVDLPKGRSAIGCRWVFKYKQGNNTENCRYKARLVAQGYTQKFGEDYDEVFAPVTRSSTFRTLLTIASARNLIVKQYDVKTAFLNGTLKEEIYMKYPPGYCDSSDKVLKLHKSLYGLKQAARVWNQTLNSSMTEAGFQQSKNDECLYMLKNPLGICYTIVHVDDMIFASTSSQLLDISIDKLNKSFELKCLGNVQNYLGIEISRNQKGIFAICQTNYIMKIASEFKLEDSKGSKYPLDPGYHKLDDNEMLNTNNEYRKLIGMLLYVSTNTRPDISAAVGILAQRVSKPRKLDLSESLRIVRYLVSTKDLKLHLFDTNDPSTLTANADSDWAEDRETRKSISGVICKIFGGTISWSSRKQDIVSTSTTESEFYALSEAVKEIQWLRNILKDFDVKVHSPITVFSDNQSTIKMVENAKFSSRTKHIDVRLHYVRDCVRLAKIALEYCPSEENVADLLTKPLAGVKIQRLRKLASLY